MFFSALSLLQPIIGAISGDHNNAMMVAGAVVVPGINKLTLQKNVLQSLPVLLLSVYPRSPDLKRLTVLVIRAYQFQF